MVRSARIVALIVAISVGGGAAYANGRSPGASTIVFEQGDPSHVISGQTFGLLVSNDSGATWSWMCETAVGYAGLYDPYYQYGPTGTIFATTFRGMRAMRDGCSFDPIEATGCAPGDPSKGACDLDGDEKCTFASTDALDGSGNVFYAAASPTDGQIYESTDDGVTFPNVGAPGKANDWWESVAIAPSDDQRIYVAGYRLSGDVPKQFLLLKSADHGATYTPVPGLAGITSTSMSTMDIAAIDATNPDIFYVVVSKEDPTHFGLWRTIDGGATFTEILQLADRMAVASRANHDLVVGTTTVGTRVSHDNGDTFQDVPGAPHINCLVENTLGELWACTAAVGSMTVPSDGAAIMKTTDLASWTPVLKYPDITGPVTCGADTKQQVCCTDMEWCLVKEQLGIRSEVVDCSVAGDVPAPKPKGCCSSGGEAPAGGTLVVGGLVAMLLVRRRRGTFAAWTRHG